jgi:hypothetical protein
MGPLRYGSELLNHVVSIPIDVCYDAPERDDVARYLTRSLLDARTPVLA